MMRIEKSDMHLFRTPDNRIIAFQVDSGLFFELDPLYEAILRRCEGQSTELVAKDLIGRYDHEEVLDAIEDLVRIGLISDGALKLLPDVPPTEVTTTCGASDETVPDDRLHITLHVSHSCNIKCAYCFAHGGDYGGKPTLMKPDVARQAVRWALNEARSSGRCQIDFFGGEPLLNFDLIQEIVPYARLYASEVGVEVFFGITTNGTLLSDEVNRFLIDENIQVQISLDGGATDQNRLRKFNNGDDTYDVVAENTQKLAAEAPDQVTLRATMTSYNMDREDVEAELKQFGVGKVVVGPVVTSPYMPWAFREEHLPVLKQNLRKRSRYELEAIRNNPKKEGYFDRHIQQLLTRSKSCHGCQGGKQFLGVDVNGSIYFCSSLADRPEFRMGDVFSGLDTEVQREFNEKFHVENRSDCQTCWARHLCGGGCIYDARTATGDPIRPNPVSCEQIRYGYELAMEMCMEIQDDDETLLQRRYNLDLIKPGNTNSGAAVA